MKFIVAKKLLSKEPSDNWKNVEFYVPPSSHLRTSSSRGVGVDASVTGSESGSMRSRTSIERLSSTITGSLHNSLRRLQPTSMFEGMQYSERPSSLHALYDVETNEVSLITVWAVFFSILLQN